MLTSGPGFLAMSSEPKKIRLFLPIIYIMDPILVQFPYLDVTVAMVVLKKGCLMMCWMRQSTWSANWCWTALVRFHQGCRSLMLFIAVSCILCVRLKGRHLGQVLSGAPRMPKMVRGRRSTGNAWFYHKHKSYKQL